MPIIKVEEGQKSLLVDIMVMQVVCLIVDLVCTVTLVINYMLKDLEALRTCWFLQTTEKAASGVSR